MLNSARTEGTRARKQRTAAANNPPQIAWHLARTSALILDASYEGDPDLTTGVLTDLVTTALAQATSAARIRDVVCETLADAHQLVDDERDDYLAVLATRWDTTPEPKNLDDALVAGVKDGIDTERLCWQIISLESLNHVGLIRKEASKLVKKLPDTRPDDLMGYGFIGLRAALRAYDPSLGFAFSTYACPKINGAIRDGIRSENPLPKRLTTLARAATNAEEQLTQELSRTPTYSEIVDFLNVEAAYSALLPRLAAPTSIEELTSVEGDFVRDLPSLVDRTTPEDEALRGAHIDAVRAAVASLPDLQRQVITRLHLQGGTLTATAAELGMDVRSVRNIRTAGEAALTELLAGYATAS